MNNVFMNLVRGNALATYVGAKGEVNKDYTFGKDYSHIECSLGSVANLEDGRVLLRPAVTVDPKKCKLLVVPNVKLSVVGNVSYQSILEPGDGKALGIVVSPTSGTADFSDLDWLCRIYAIY